ncbi:nucleoside diphosphate kinase [Tulasnella sp. 419]|nr:nucleoside diphosphate kinase [Tulasnella sp. 419]
MLKAIESCTAASAEVLRHAFCFSDNASTDSDSSSSSMANLRERTYIMIKPDGVQRSLVGTIIARFESRGYKLIALKMVHATPEHLEKHYADLSDKPFFRGLVDYMASGPVVGMVWEGLDAVKTGRAILGATNPLASAPGMFLLDMKRVTEYTDTRSGSSF